jgi:hypothetical protein
MNVTRYHKLLRVSVSVVALLLVFDSGFIFPITKQLSSNTLEYLGGAVGMSVAVPPNELNVITAELSARDRALREREAALAEREINTRNFGQENETDYSTYILSTILFMLMVLIVLNYALDFVRARKLTYERTTA